MHLSSVKASIFQIASFDLFYGSLPAKVARGGLGVVLFLLLILPLTQQTEKPPYLAFSLFILFVMFEAFYRYKLSFWKPAARVGQVGDYQKFISLSLAKILLKTSDWKAVGSLFSSLDSAKLVAEVLTRADFSREETASLKKSLADEKTDLNQLMTTAAEYTKKEKRSFVDEIDLLLTLFEKSPLLARALFQKKLKSSDLLNIAFWIRGEESVPFWEKSPKRMGQGMGEFWSGGWTYWTEQYTLDLSKGLVKGSFDGTLIGRDKEITQIEEVLGRGSKRNLILLGEPGIGKEALIYGLALKSLVGTLPEELKYKRFLQLDLTSLVAQAQGGELEDRIKSIFDELSHAGNVVLYIPQIESIAGATYDLSGLIFNQIANSALQIIATSTRNAYHQYIEQKPAFSEHFEVTDIPETSQEETIRILEGRLAQIEKKHRVTVTYKALTYCVELANRYLTDRVFPGKGIDLLDEIAAAVNLKKKAVVEPGDVESVLTAKTKVPIALASGEEAEKLLNLEKTLHQRVISQNEAITSVAEAVRRARTMVRTSPRPIGVFLFLGPTGVGKTETAKALAQSYFGDEKAIIRLDMSEFENETSINRLIGPPPGQSGFESGGQLMEAVRTKPFSLILLDEMEKAHQKIQETFLAIFDEGKAADSSGRIISFTNTIIIATSNAGAEYIRESVNANLPLTQIKTSLLDKLQREGTFKPEFLNRFDDVIVFKPLSQTEVVEVVKLLFADLVKRMEQQDIKLQVTAATLEFLAKKGYDPTYGARSLRRLMQDEVEALLSKKLLEGSLQRGSSVILDFQNDNLSLLPTVPNS
ncbi:MAG: ATP-dependent Clp protease ATP-binding subunit [bacterium]|nr:ATP-dependent Clp protease ATP-binding subunit [bacterium]